MAVNSSSYDSLLLPHLPFKDAHILLCSMSAPSSFIYFSFYTANAIFLLPPCILILYLGLQRWRQQRSASTAAVTSHSDSFTYHMVVMELVGILGSILRCYGIYSYDAYAVMVGFYLYAFTWYGESFFHVLTSVERYLAVVHPITYLSLKSERGIRIRNFTIGCVWLLTVGEITLMILESFVVIFEFCLLIFFSVVVFFCSLSVLCILIRPGPGEQGGDRVDQSKQRAFYTILIVQGVLMLRFGWNLVWINLYVREQTDCVMIAWNSWFNIPCSLVLPLLFLRRAGILACCKTNTIKG